MFTKWRVNRNALTFLEPCSLKTPFRVVQWDFPSTAFSSARQRSRESPIRHRRHITPSATAPTSRTSSADILLLKRTNIIVLMHILTWIYDQNDKSVKKKLRPTELQTSGSNATALTTWNHVKMAPDMLDIHNWMDGGRSAQRDVSKEAATNQSVTKQRLHSKFLCEEQNDEGNTMTHK